MAVRFGAYWARGQNLNSVFTHSPIEVNHKEKRQITVDATEMGGEEQGRGQVDGVESDQGYDVEQKKVIKKQKHE